MEIKQKDNSNNSKEQQISDIATEILRQSRNSLFIKLRFLDLALGQFSNTTTSDKEIKTYVTDGKIFKYNPVHLIRKYKENNNSVSRNYLHIILHCIFRHMFVSPTFDQKYWDLACDIAVENIITELNLKNLSVEEETEQQHYISTIKNKVKYLTAECIYYYLKEIELPDGNIKELNKIFSVDSHELWHKATQATTDHWKEISEQIQVDLETFNQEQGNKACSLVQNLKEVNREKYDYTTFLKKFATPCEVVKINDDEFDYVYYTYGLSLYKNMPLVEPLEYKDVKRVKDFVIAIDTSGSVQGDLVQAFLQKTYNILKSTESFYSKVNIHIIQCDAEIQEDVKITNQEEFDNYITNTKLHGLGGTDFRPVFSYVDNLIKCKEFENLKGLIYFTDGQGSFPATKPQYQTAFVFIDDEYNNYEVPSWAIKLILQPQDI